LARSRLSIPGRDRKSRRRSCRGTDEESDGCVGKDGMTWERITRLANDWLPKPRILHPWPQARFAVTHPRCEPYAGIPLVRICAGGAQR
jgi:hypothetical protein